MFLSITFCLQSQCFIISWDITEIKSPPYFFLTSRIRILVSSSNYSDSYFCVTSLWLLSLKNDVNVPSKSNKQKMLTSCRSLTKIAGSGSASLSQRYGSADPDPYQNFMDTQHCYSCKHLSVWQASPPWCRTASPPWPGASSISCSPTTICWRCPRWRSGSSGSSTISISTRTTFQPLGETLERLYCVSYIRLLSKMEMWCNHRLNMELDLQSSFGLHVTWCAQLFSLAETPQPPPSPPHLVSYTRGAIGQLVRRFGPLMSCAHYKLGVLTKELASHGCQSESWKAQHIKSAKQKSINRNIVERGTLQTHPSITKTESLTLRINVYVMRNFPGDIVMYTLHHRLR